MTKSLLIVCLLLSITYSIAERERCGPHTWCPEGLICCRRGSLCCVPNEESLRENFLFTSDERPYNQDDSVVNY
uniref:Cysteine rich secreted protein n=1 Tax=Riptortus pedestris TaxID=329032 RepID=R4WIK8_RIPPE|nr:cysteine rich secreted protein [Riptortus pedestris]